LVSAQNSCNAEAAQKILSTVPYAQGFHFFMTDVHYTGETALSICSFLRDMGSVDVQSIKFHFDRGDLAHAVYACVSHNLASGVEMIEYDQFVDLLAQDNQKVINF
jgi:hypothetical protein